jgi:5-methylthioadenosine/S-adenosylhomocysteine deaminase
LDALLKPELEIIRKRHYHEFDTYFIFEDPDQGLLRYREDEFIDDKGALTSVRSRLTLIGQAAEKFFPSEVLLSRSRFFAPATQSLRFYREYFRPNREFEIHKDRLRFLVTYRKTDFYINIDEVSKPDLGYYLEVKARTWSRRDAEVKSKLAVELVSVLNASPAEAISKDYFDMILEG